MASRGQRITMTSSTSIEALSTSRTRRLAARAVCSRTGGFIANVPPVSWIMRRLTGIAVRRLVRQQPHAAAVERRAGTSLQARLDEIARDVVDVLGYTGAMIATYEQGDSLPVRSFYADPTVLSSKDVARWEAQISRFRPGYNLSITNPDVARVYVFREEHQQNLGVQAARAGKPIVSNKLYDLFRPIVPLAAKPLVAGIQRALGIRQVIAVPFFLEVTTDGRVQRELVGNLFAIKRGTIGDNDVLLLSAFGRQAAASILSERRRVQIEVTQELTYQMQTHLQDETQILDRIAEGVVADLGYVGCMVSTYEEDGSLPVRSMYVDPQVASTEQIRQWAAQIERFMSPGSKLSIDDPAAPRVFVHQAEYAENINVMAARSGRPIVSNNLYDLFRPIVPSAAKLIVAEAQQVLGVQQIIAVPFFREVLVEGFPTRELVGNLFAATRSQQFSSGEIGLLQAFGQQAAAAIHNARLYHQSENRRLAAQIFGKMAFSAAASVHAMRNHIGVIRGNIQLLTILDAFPANERDELLKSMSRPVFEHLERMIDILDTLHEPWQQQQECSTHVNICLLRGLKKAGGEHAKYVQLELTEDLPEVNAAPDMLAEAFSMLIKRSLQASVRNNEERSITIRSVALKDVVVVTIRDNSQGLSPDQLRRIFEIRRRVAEPGVGFGLYWTKEYIEGIGGQLDVMSVQGEGTTFRLILPQVQNHS